MIQCDYTVPGFITLWILVGNITERAEDMKTVSRITGLLLSASLGTISMLLSVVSSNAAEHTVIINEVCTQNKASLLDSYGSASDWIELYNSSDSSISLGGWVIADAGSTWTFPAGAEIAAGEYMILFASKSVSTETEDKTGVFSK